MMRRATLFALFGVVGVVGVADQGLAGDRNRPVSAHRRLALCMSKEMAASRSISYNQASATCKARLQPKSDTPALASSIQSKPGNGFSK